MTNLSTPEPTALSRDQRDHSALVLTEEAAELRSQADRLRRRVRRRFWVIMGFMTVSWLVVLIMLKQGWAAWMMIQGATAVAVAASKYLRRRDTARLRSRLAVLTPEQRRGVLEPLVRDTRSGEGPNSVIHDLIKDLEAPPGDVIPSQSPEGSGSEVAPDDSSRLPAERR